MNFVQRLARLISPIFRAEIISTNEALVFKNNTAKRVICIFYVYFT